MIVIFSFQVCCFCQSRDEIFEYVWCYSKFSDLHQNRPFTTVNGSVNFLFILCFRSMQNQSNFHCCPLLCSPLSTDNTLVYCLTLTSVTGSLLKDIFANSFDENYRRMKWSILVLLKYCCPRLSSLSARQCTVIMTPANWQRPLLMAPTLPPASTARGLAWFSSVLLAVLVSSLSSDRSRDERLTPAIYCYLV